jgi:hypothetical protein
VVGAHRHPDYCRMSLLDRSPGATIVLANVVLYTTVCLEIWMLASHSIAAMVGVYALIIMISGLLVRWMLQILGPEDHGLDYEPEPAAAAVEAKGRPAVIAHQPILH